MLGGQTFTISALRHATQDTDTTSALETQTLSPFMVKSHTSPGAALDRGCKHPRTGHSTRRPVEGLRQGSEEGVPKGDLAGGGREWWPTMVQAPASVEEGQEGGCTRVQTPPPRARPSCARQSCPRLGKLRHGCVPSASHPHVTRPTPVLRHQIRFIRGGF